MKQDEEKEKSEVKGERRNEIIVNKRGERRRKIIQKAEEENQKEKDERRG